jgi:hypothetical protein
MTLKRTAANLLPPGSEHPDQRTGAHHWSDDQKSHGRPPPEKRKSYLFRPQTMLTQQRLFETILEADGITPEMIKSQQEKLHLLQQLLGASAEGCPR